MPDKPSAEMIELYRSRILIIPFILVHCIGLWPWQPYRVLVSMIWLVATLITTFPQINGLIANRNNPDVLLDNLLMCSVMFAICMKLFTMVIAANKSKQQYLAIAENHKLITDHEERVILMNYSERGRLINILYITFQTIVYMSFVFGPLIPLVLNVVYPLETPRPHVYQLRGKFPFENRDDHYVFIYSWDTTATTCVLAIGAPVDAMYAASVEHGLALLAIMKFRLLRLKRMTADDQPSGKDYSYEFMVGIIQLHQRTLHYVDLIERSYSLCFLVLIWLNFIFIPILCLLILIHMVDLLNLFRYILFLGCAIVHLFNIFWPGQKIINHSDDVYISACFNEWYTCSKQTKQLIHIFLLRCSQPTLLTGGNLMVLNFENYAAIVKSAISYITVFSSFR